jgi:hypothetical protein
LGGSVIGVESPANDCVLLSLVRLRGATPEPNQRTILGEVQVSTPDVKISDNGSVVLLEPMSLRARQWLICNPWIEKWPWRGSALTIEPRLAPDLISAMIDHGLRVLGYNRQEAQAR